MVPSTGKDATISTTNLAIAALISNYLYTHGIQLDPETIIAIATTLIGFWGRWRAGGVASVLGIKIPQPKPEANAL